MKSNRSFTFDELLTGNRSEEFIESAYPFMKLMMQYQCAMLEVRTKFEVLNTELSLDSDRNPIESISCRIKKPISIAEKLKRKGLEVSLQSIEENLHDVAGIRVVCFFFKGYLQACRQQAPGRISGDKKRRTSAGSIL